MFPPLQVFLRSLLLAIIWATFNKTLLVACFQWLQKRRFGRKEKGELEDERSSFLLRLCSLGKKTKLTDWHTRFEFCAVRRFLKLFIFRKCSKCDKQEFLSSIYLIDYYKFFVHFFLSLPYSKQDQIINKMIFSCFVSQVFKDVVLSILKDFCRQAGDKQRS